jgi:hypothetical protein
MTLPIQANVTLDIYRNTNAPPNPPDVAGVKGHLFEKFGNIKPPGSNTMPYGSYTHVLFVEVNTDIRDGAGGGADKVYVPSQSGTQFTVVWVARQGRGTPLDMKIVYLTRATPTWPTSDL